MDEYGPTNPWKIREQEFPSIGSSTEKLKFLLRYAILAPSSHNTQPWKFSVGKDNDEIRVMVNEKRWLRVADPDRRELYISAGCALENLLIAAEHFGYVYQIEYFPEGTEITVAKVGLKPRDKSKKTQDPLFEAMPKRCTNHTLYEDRAIPKTDIARLHACCDEEGFWLFPTSEAPNEAGLRRRVDELITLADAIQLTDREYKSELGYWIGQGVFGSSWLMAKVGQLAVSYLNLSKGQNKKNSELLLSAPVLVAMGSAVDDRESRVIIGRIFERVFLTATILGIAIQPMSQILEVPEVKYELSKLLPIENVIPQHTFRMGYASGEEQHTPRQPLEKFLV